jgi:uncharacterized protein YbbC (DUF1343 family)
LAENALPYASKALGLVCNQATVAPDRRHALWHLDKALPGAVKALFSPQHGFRGEKQDNMVESAHSETRDGRPIHSLYGESRTPSQDALRGLDALLFDLPDMGTRVYTFAQTLALTLPAAREAGVEVIVLDRPNPIGGMALEGNLLDPDCASFVGLYPVPARHGFTLGEYALFMNASLPKPALLKVIPARNWSRELYLPETGLPWVLPSPNLPTPETAWIYPGSVIFEGTNISEGRGTTRPFHLIGAPFIDPELLAADLEELRLPGVFFRPCRFLPTFQKWAGTDCGGVEICPLDKSFAPFLVGLSLLEKIMRRYPQDFRLKEPPYEYETIRRPIDLILGRRSLFDSLQNGASARDLVASFAPELAKFARERREFLLYP